MTKSTVPETTIKIGYDDLAPIRWAARVGSRVVDLLLFLGRFLKRVFD